MTGTWKNSCARRQRRWTLDLGEGRRRAGKDRTYLWRVAGGSADEARVGLLIAEAWTYVAHDEIAEALELLDRLLAITWTLTR
ncbi:MAG: hypothetical protein GY719_11610 [bacterium]|nr:hypothetical protein [bacterium]